MTTLVMVEKDGCACIAAESLTTAGLLKQPAKYVENHEKILRVGDAYLGFVGWRVNQTVMESVLASGLELPEVRRDLDLFEFARKLHKKLKKEYFLNARDKEQLWEWSPMALFLVNRHGLFALHGDRCVEQSRRFAAVGSGQEYALGAMYAAYELDLPAEDVARLGVEAGTEFDPYSQGPITLRKVKLAR